MHLGHVFSALFTQYWARSLGGVALLRIEDIDTARCREDFVVWMLEDLTWIGFTWPEPVRRQSRHFADYEAAAHQLREMGLLYPCFCTRAEIRAASDGRTDPDGAPLYPGTCRHLDASTRQARLLAGEPAQWRLKMDAAVEQAGPLTIAEASPTPDQASVERPADPARWGDVVLVRKDTPTSYHLSVVVDDAIQGITHVTRGMDLYAATDIHRVLQALFALPAPFYCHHRLVFDDGDEKLSKSKNSQSLRALREQGWTPTELAARLGIGV